MPKESLVVSAVIPTTPQSLHDAWLDPVAHAAMTGSEASLDRDGTFHACAGYITARTITDTSALIVQQWRTTQFPAEDGDSVVELQLVAVRGGTRVTVTQTGIPSGQAATYAAEWQQRYFGPMTEHFDAATKKTAKPKPAAKTTAKPKPAAKKAAKPKPAAKTTAKPKPAAKTTAKPKPAAKKAAKPKPAAKQTAKPKPAAKTTAKPKPAAKTTAKAKPTKKAAAAR
jgi:hypothetical protein